MFSHSTMTLMRLGSTITALWMASLSALSVGMTVSLVAFVLREQGTPSNAMGAPRLGEEHTPLGVNTFAEPQNRRTAPMASHPK